MNPIDQQAEALASAIGAYVQRAAQVALRDHDLILTGHQQAASCEKTKQILLSDPDFLSMLENHIESNQTVDRKGRIHAVAFLAAIKQELDCAQEPRDRAMLSNLHNNARIVFEQLKLTRERQHG